jgi:hypothetical protein
MLDVMAYLYGDRISDTESAKLVVKLRDRGTAAASLAADTVTRGASRDATAESSLSARDAILLELRDWPGLDSEAPSLAALRDRLAAPEGLRII